MGLERLPYPLVENILKSLSLRARIVGGVVDFVDAPLLLPQGFDGDVLESFGGVLVVAIGVLVGQAWLFLEEVLALGGEGLHCGRVGPLGRGVEDIKRVVLLHC